MNIKHKILLLSLAFGLVQVQADSIKIIYNDNCPSVSPKEYVKILQTSGEIKSARNYFSGCNYSGVDLSGLDLSNFNFSNSILIHVNFDNTNLTGANFTNTTLCYANFTNANLTNVNITNANLYKVKWNGTNLTGANFTDAFYMKPILKNIHGFISLMRKNIKNVIHGREVTKV